MGWTILGISCTTALTVIAIWGDVKKGWVRGLLIIMVIGSLSGQVISSGKSDKEKTLAQEKQEKAEKIALQAKQDLADLKETLTLVRITVGDLGKLNDLSGGRKYYVRIAADTSKERLAKFLKKIEGQFKGASASGLVTIRDPKTGSQNYELVFGQHLDVAAVEVFHRLAMSHKLPPEGNIAAILPE